MTPERPVRRQNRLSAYDYSQNGAYFIIICTKERKCILSHIPAGWENDCFFAEESHGTEIY